MNKPEQLLSQLFPIRNFYGEKYSTEKMRLLTEISSESLKTKRALQSWYDILLFLLAYPDNPSVYELASRCLQQLESYVQSHENIQRRLFNSGIANTRLCAAFGFEIVKWLTTRFPQNVSL